MTTKYFFKLITTLTILYSFLSCNRITEPKKTNIDTELEPITFLKDGGWCWFQDPRAIINNGQLIVGGLDGQTGDVRVGIYDLEKNQFLGQTILQEKLEIDDHDAPVFYVRSDGSILSMWSKHSRNNKHYYSISEPNDYLKWSDKTIYTHDFEVQEGNVWGGTCYQNLYTIKDSGLLYNFFRIGVDLNPYFITSNDEGKTWSENKTHFISDHIEGYHRPYVRYTQINDNRIGFSYTNAHPDMYGNNLYYNEFDGKNYYDVSGKKIHSIDNGPLSTADGDLIYKGSESFNKPDSLAAIPNSAWTSSQEKNIKGQPYIGYTVYWNDNDIRYRLANWTGEIWNDREIAFAGTGVSPINNYAGLIALDPENPKNIALSSNVNPVTGETINQHEIFYATDISDQDHTNTIEWQQITSNSKHINIRPMIVTGEGYKVLLWMTGPWNGFLSYDTDVIGYILEQPKK